MASELMDIDQPDGQPNGQTPNLDGDGASTSKPDSFPTTRTSSVIATFRPTKLFRRDDLKAGQPQPHVLSLDYDDKGELLMTSESDETIQIYSVVEGQHSKSLVTKKYGAKLAKFTHATQGVIFASTKQNDAIRYLSTHDNTFIRYFEGHEANVTCLAMHPGADQFISCSMDNTARIWDARSRHWQGKLYLHHPYLAGFDPAASAFAIGSPSSGTVLLYDYRLYEKGPFSTFDLLESCRHVDPQMTVKGWTKVEFSNDGKSLIVATRGNGHFVLDAFDGTLRAYLRKPEGPTRRSAPGEGYSAAAAAAAAAANGGSWPSPAHFESSGDCAFTADGRYVLGGSKKDVLVWDLHSPVGERKVLSPTHVLSDKREAAVLAVNPLYNFFATADQEVIFWMPDIHP